MDVQRLTTALKQASEALLAERNALGFWEGELSSSALSTATAVTALVLAQRHRAAFPAGHDIGAVMRNGLQWLTQHQNVDGGWGDTTKSLSNISTTTLCWAAFGAAQADEQFRSTVGRAERWLSERAGSIEPSTLAPTIIARYGKDRTFSVPILTLCALAGRLGTGRDAWRHVIPLPFELAALPHQFFAALRLPVVSYALPALIAIGYARHFHAPSSNKLVRGVRAAARDKTLRVLESIQPENGGFLEATPLTSFVTMSLAASGLAQHLVTRRGLRFLLTSQRPDGSWPIDTNLSTWCTTLAIEALRGGTRRSVESVVPWLLQQQHRIEHPYTHAAPGGWAWTDLPGGVPDADDTGGALVALATLRAQVAETETAPIDRAAELGLRWLMGLQNSDGGIPTFCRGWGALPFDRSSPDITAHAIRAWLAWRHQFDGSLDEAMRTSRWRAIDYLRRAQEHDGSWVPLWFGNQHAPDDENRIYGTARVLAALAECGDEACSMLSRGVSFLVTLQQSNGGWSAARRAEPSVEETALTVQALARVAPLQTLDANALESLQRGTAWLMQAVESGRSREPSPIGFYFAKLWYYERLYPMIFTAGALRDVADLLRVGDDWR
jgi:squalene-hopene/tetraprenyl-beta-curcumene cyclase